MPVYELRDQLLAGAAFADEHDARVSHRDLARQLNDLAERRRRAEQRHLVAVAVLLHERRAGALAFASALYRNGGAADQDLEMRAGEWLREVVPGTQA